MQIRRILRHWSTLPGAVHRAFPDNTLQHIRERIEASELHHSGEIRFAVESSLPWSYLWRDAPARARALMMFSKLHVWDTEHNNGVLVYVLLADRSIEIVADRALAARVAPTAWQAIADEMRTRFRADDFGAGALAGVDAVGALLAQHFPLGAGQRNPDELPNAPSVL